jgi:four helix bundle protein
VKSEQVRRESHYWLRLIKAMELVTTKELDTLIEEASEIKKVLGATVSTARGKRK